MMKTIGQIISTFQYKGAPFNEGIPANLTQATVTQELDFLEGAGVANRGLQNRQFEFRTLARTNHPLSINFFFSEGILHLVEFDHWSNDDKESTWAKSQLGEPEKKLDFFWRGEKFLTGLELWSSKGLSVGHVFARPAIIQLCLFSNCAAENYMQNYWQLDDFREFSNQSFGAN